MASEQDGEGLRPPPQPPAMVRAVREHVTARFAQGVDQLVWEAHKRPMPDATAADLVVEAADAGAADAADLAAALILVQAAQLDLDRLAWRVMKAAERAGMTPETIAAVLELPSAEQARRYSRWLGERAALPVDEVPAPDAAPGPADRRVGR
jgi:hypothetical protein